MFYRPPAPDGPGHLEVSGEAWANLARVIYVAHGGQHPGDPPAAGPAP